MRHFMRAGPQFTTRSHPLPLTEGESTQLDFVLIVLAALFVLIPFCYLTGAYVISIVSEQTSGARHMQLASGCPALAYWLGSFLWDLFTHGIVVLLAIVIFAAYQHSPTTGSFTQVHFRAAGWLCVPPCRGGCPTKLCCCCKVMVPLPCGEVQVLMLSNDKWGVWRRRWARCAC